MRWIWELPVNRLGRLIEEVRGEVPRRTEGSGRPEAAVAVVLVPDPDRLLVIRRAERAGDPWSGQLALPGGRRSRTDPGLLATAIRETEEEVSVRLDPAWCVAHLDDLLPTSPVLPPILVRPFLFTLGAAVEPVPGDEVASAGWIPLQILAEPGVYRGATLELRGESRQVMGYHLAEGLLWGLTERIVTPLLNRWKLLAPT